jgi:anti-anti-sigma regulatory factor
VLRITLTNHDDATATLTLEGRLAGAWVDELVNACAAAADGGGRLVLDMVGVTFVDPEGVRLVRRLSERGIAIRDCSPFVREQLEGACDD